MNIKNTLFLSIFFLFSNLSFSQAELNQNKEKISNAFTEFFKMDRENIHLHTNKTTYLSTDEIWFKGYILEKKSRKPYVATSNVYITLIDGTGEKIKTHLFYAENSVFDGSIKLDENTQTGTYYLQVYTNYMNNFMEDESSIYEINIINPTDGKMPANTNSKNFSVVNTEFFPESTVFLEGTSNTVGIKITDCNGNGISIKDGEIKDAQGITVTNFTTNELGYGKFDILQTKNEVYKAVFLVETKNIEKALPLPTANGITFSVNNYTFENKTTLKVKTNANSLNEYKNSPLTLVIQQNDNTSFVDFSFKENAPEQLLVIPGTDFSEGINTLYLIDKNAKKIAERIIFKPSKTNAAIDLKILKKQNDSIFISGKSALAMGSISVSVLPNDSKSLSDQKNIYTSFLFDNQLNDKAPKGNYFLSNFSKRKHYELDTYLICQKSKYSWQAMMSAPPQKKFDFDNGLTFKGTINKPLEDKKSFKVQLSSIAAGLNEFSEINDKNEFYFKNILVSDSATVHFSLLDKKERKSEIKLFAQILNNNRPFIKSFKVAKTECPTEINNSTDDSNYSFPKIANTVRLDSITIAGKVKKTPLANERRHNNSMSKGYKITEADSSRDLLQFIAANGYDVSIQGTSVIIIGRRATSFLGTRSPAIYIDDAPVMDFSQLLGYSLNSVDEIYINKNGYGGGMDAANGIIRVYSKKGTGGARKIKINSQSFTVKNGFQNNKNYINPKYTSYSDEGFKNFGNIHWEPYVESDENGLFTFAIPNYYQKTVKIVIEGIGTNGELISEIKTIAVP